MHTCSNRKLWEIHESFANDVWDSSQARVVLLERRLIERFHDRLIPFRSDPFSKPNYLLTDKRGVKIQKIVICIPHPQHLGLYASIFDVMKTDRNINLTVALSTARCSISLSALSQHTISRIPNQSTPPSDKPLVTDIRSIIKQGFMYIDHKPTTDPNTYLAQIQELLNISVANTNISDLDEDNTPCTTKDCLEPAFSQGHCHSYLMETLGELKLSRPQKPPCQFDGCVTILRHIRDSKNIAKHTTIKCTLMQIVV